jgi:ATP-dependent helicase/DNAse subunit B
VLWLGSAERPEEILRITALDRGNLVHQVLERYVLTLLAGEERSLERLHAIAEELFEEVESKGLAGKPLLRRYEKEVMLRELAAFFADDVHTPLAAELPFGMDGSEPVVLTLPDGRRIGFRGKADRVDDDGRGGLVVTDYKTGRGHGYEQVAKDPVDRGRRLQLPLYGLAARDRFGEDRPVHARYVMVSERANYAEYGIDVDDAVMDRFTDVLDVIVSGIAAGAFPTRPGELSSWTGTWDNCTYCEFDRLCPVGRDAHWHTKKHSEPALRRYVDLAEGDPADA